MGTVHPVEHVFIGYHRRYSRINSDRNPADSRNDAGCRGHSCYGYV
jgi:hypothetical protein